MCEVISLNIERSAENARSTHLIGSFLSTRFVTRQCDIDGSREEGVVVDVTTLRTGSLQREKEKGLRDSYYYLIE